VIRLLGGRAGGAERLFCGTANLLAAAGLRVTVLFHDADDRRPAYPLDVAAINLRGRRGVPERAFRIAAKGYPQVQALAGFDWIARHSPFTRGLVSAIRELRPDAVISWLPSANTPALIAGWVTGVPVIPTNHSVPEHDYGDATRWDPNPIDRALRRFVLRAAARIHVLFPAYAAWFPPAVRERVVAIPNYVAPEFTPAAVPRTSTIVSAGRLVTSKDHATLIDAWAELAPRHPTWDLAIHGEGPHRVELERRLDDRGLPRSILKGHTPDLVPVYRGASIGVHPSRFEGFGLAVAEALACGLPMVGFTDCHALRELIMDATNGRLVARDPAILAAALDQLISDPDHRRQLSDAAPASMERYGVDAYRTRWLTVLGEVIR